jgi:outer membrane protein with beta-barrel domain
MVTLATVALPSRASADGFISPFLGVNFGNPSANGRASFGTQLTWMGAGAVGFEADFGWAPSFFGNEGDFGDNRVVTLTGNVIFGVPVGGTRGTGFRPYVTVGGGLIHQRVNVPGAPFEVSNNDFGLSAGAGFVNFFNDHAGLRGDVRYFRDLKDNVAVDTGDIDFGSFHFWRASAGLAIRF